MVRCTRFSPTGPGEIFDPVGASPLVNRPLASNAEVPSVKTGDVLKTYKSALSVASGYLSNRLPIDRPSLSGGLSEFPPTLNGPWKMDMASAERTLKYIFDVLHQACYMLCVNQGAPNLVKLEPEGMPSVFEGELAAAKKKDPRLAAALGSGEIQLMQCVVKKKKEEASFTAEYSKWINTWTIPLPDGVYILNLTDSVLIRNDGRPPWEELGDPLPVDKMPTYLPVLGGSGNVDFYDIPIPNYDDIRVVLGYDELKKYDTKWSAKKDAAVFRGAPTGCGTTARTNMRIRLAGMRKEGLDVGLVRDKASRPRYDPKKGFSITDIEDIPVVPFMSMDEQSKYRYNIHIDGNVAAYRLLKFMAMGSVVLKVEGPYTLWVDHVLKDKIHYVGVKADLSDLEEKLDWCRKHQGECQRIAALGAAFAKKALTVEYVNQTFAKILWQLSERVGPLPREPGFVNTPGSNSNSTGTTNTGKTNTGTTSSPLAKPSPTREVFTPPTKEETTEFIKRAVKKGCLMPLSDVAKIHGIIAPPIVNAIEYPERPIALILCGPPGSGKTTIKNKIFTERGINPGEYIDADPDKIMIHITPWQKGTAGVKEKCRQFGTNVLVDLFMEKYFNSGYHIAFDTTCRDKDITDTAIGLAQASGYHVILVQMYVSKAVARARVAGRQAAKAEGGRIVPNEVVDRIHDEFAAVAERIFDESEEIDEVYLYNNEAESEDAVVLFQKKRDAAGKVEILCPGRGSGKNFYFNWEGACPTSGGKTRKRVMRRRKSLKRK